MTDATSFDLERRAKQLTDLDRLAQRFGTSLSSAFAKNVQGAGASTRCWARSAARSSTPACAPP
jgi:hypothetical protein